VKEVLHRAFYALSGSWTGGEGAPGLSRRGVFEVFSDVIAMGWDFAVNVHLGICLISVQNMTIDGWIEVI
jgi:hypothetical protein